MYRVFLERSAERDLGRLSSEVHHRVIVAIQGLANNPRPPGLPQADGQQKRLAHSRGRLPGDL
jgi:mRNA-degrading endonuclease RelE of RelBE toxin-antitoxin system